MISNAILKLVVVALAIASHPEKRLISQRMVSHAAAAEEFEVLRTVATTNSDSENLGFNFCCRNMLTLF